jgi:hypothetical protein
VDFDPAGTSTKVNVHTDKSVDMHTNVQIAQGTIPSSSVITNNSYLYSLGSSPICVHTFVEVPAGSKSTLGVAFLALRGFPPFEVCKKGLVFAL